MVFSSLTFVLFFLPAIILLYFFDKNPKYRNIVLLIFSLIFYAWGEPKWIFVMLLTVTVNYAAGLMISKAKSKKTRVLWMLAGVGLSLGFLFYFKYCGFLTETVTSLLGVNNPFKSPVLPIGISFYTFQVITYTVDVYKEKVPVQKNYARLLLYISFFPQLIAGPIVNYKDIEGYLGERTVLADDFYEGFMRFFIGFSKKVLIANTCGLITEKIIGAGEMSVAGAWIMAIAYTLQIYFDFSGYSDMAIGLGRMFGFKFLENFDYPYTSKSITEFWRRWHISLGSFFREYVYIPLGGNRVGKAKHIRNIMIVWMLTGIWHGASWNFIIWGLYYGVLLLAEKYIFLKIKEKIPAIINIVITLVFVIIGWIFFYYTDLSEGIRHLGIMFGFIKTSLTDPVSTYYFKHYFVLLVIGVLASISWKRIGEKLFAKRIPNAQSLAASISVWAKPVAVTLLFLLSMAMIIGQSYNPFLYFRF